MLDHHCTLMTGKTRIMNEVSFIGNSRNVTPDDMKTFIQAFRLQSEGKYRDALLIYGKLKQKYPENKILRNNMDMCRGFLRDNG